MSRLTYKQREKMPKKSFALPGKKTKGNPAGHGAYPIEDKAHARNALARVSQFGSPEEKARVRAKVHAKYPDIKQAKKSTKGSPPITSDEMKQGYRNLGSAS